jgi:hypothetical protein
MDQSDIQRLIGEAARRHGLLLEPSDPLFVTITLNELILIHHLDRMQATIEAAQDQISAGAVQQREAAKAIAERTIASGADYVTRTIGEAVAEMELAIRSTAAQELAAIRQAGLEARTERRSAQIAAMLAVGAVSILLGAGIAWLLHDGSDSPPPAGTTSFATTSRSPS